MSSVLDCGPGDVLVIRFAPAVAPATSTGGSSRPAEGVVGGASGLRDEAAAK